MSFKMVRLDQFHFIQKKVVLYHYKGVDAKHYASHVLAVPFPVTTDTKGEQSGNIHTNFEYNSYFQFDLNSFPDGSVIDMKAYMDTAISKIKLNG